MKRRQPEGTAHYQGGAGGATLVDRGPAEQPHRGHSFTWATSGFKEFEELHLAMRRAATQATGCIVVLKIDNQCKLHMVRSIQLPGQGELGHCGGDTPVRVLHTVVDDKDCAIAVQPFEHAEDCEVKYLVLCLSSGALCGQYVPEYGWNMLPSGEFNDAADGGMAANGIALLKDGRAVIFDETTYQLQVFESVDDAR